MTVCYPHPQGDIVMPDGSTVNYDGMPNTNFRVIFPKLPWVVLFLQGFSMPSFGVNEVSRVTPYADINEVGEKINYDPFSVSYFIDSGLKTYKSIYDWTKRMTVAGSLVGETDNAILVINNVAMIRFLDVWPMTTTGLEFDVTNQDVTYLRATTTFNYDYFEFIGPNELPLYMNAMP